MSALSDLQDSMSLLQTNASTSTSSVLAAIADIKTLPANDAALVPITAAVVSIATQLKADSDALLAAIAPPVVTPPAVTPSVA